MNRVFDCVQIVAIAVFLLVIVSKAARRDWVLYSSFMPLPSSLFG